MCSPAITPARSFWVTVVLCTKFYIGPGPLGITGRNCIGISSTFPQHSTEIKFEVDEFPASTDVGTTVALGKCFSLHCF
jgi:hypothetical protein